jgi:hypothetical protein
VKGFLSFNPLAFTHVPPEVTTSKLCDDLMFGNSVWRCVYKFMVYFGEELETFFMVWTFFTWRFKLILRMLNWSANESKTLSLSDQSL